MGRERVDLLIKWPTFSERAQKIVIELKIRYQEKTLMDGLNQIANYMDACHATEGHLVIFDRDPHKSWEEKIASDKMKVRGHEVIVWMM